MKNLTWLSCLGLLWAMPALAQSRSLAEAERAYQSVDFPRAHTLAQQTLEAGGASREDTERLYVLLGISSAALGDVDEAKQDFTIALAIDPSLKLDKSLSPKIRGPYLEAQGYWAASSKRLSLTAEPSSDALHLILHWLDPAALATDLELQVTRSGTSEHATFRLEPAALTRFALPPRWAGQRFELTLRALDRHGNVLSEYRSNVDPRPALAASAPAKSETGPRSSAPSRSYLLPATLAVSGVGALAAGIFFHVQREAAAHDWNGPNCENPGQTRIQQCQGLNSERQNDQRWAIGLYSASGALLTSSLIALVAGEPRAARTNRADSFGCTPSAAGVSCNGQF